MKNTRSDSTAYTIVISTSRTPTTSSIVQTFSLKGGQSATFPGPSGATLHALYRLGSGYDWAATHTAGACPAATVNKSWAGDATLTSSCACK